MSYGSNTLNIDTYKKLLDFIYEYSNNSLVNKREIELTNIKEILKKYNEKKIIKFIEIKEKEEAERAAEEKKEEAERAAAKAGEEEAGEAAEEKKEEEVETPEAAETTAKAAETTAKAAEEKKEEAAEEADEREVETPEGEVPEAIETKAKAAEGKKGEEKPNINNIKFKLYFKDGSFIPIIDNKYIIIENEIKKYKISDTIDGELKYELYDNNNEFDLTNRVNPIKIPRIIYKSILDENKYLLYAIFESSSIIKDIFENVEIETMSSADLEKYLLLYESSKYNLSYDDNKIISSTINSNHAKIYENLLKEYRTKKNIDGLNKLAIFVQVESSNNFINYQKKIIGTKEEDIENPTTIFGKYILTEHNIPPSNFILKTIFQISATKYYYLYEKNSNKTKKGGSPENNPSFPSGTNQSYSPVTNPSSPPGTNPSSPPGNNLSHSLGTNPLYPPGTNLSHSLGTNPLYPSGTYATPPGTYATPHSEKLPEIITNLIEFYEILNNEINISKNTTNSSNNFTKNYQNKINENINNYKNNKTLGNKELFHVLNKTSNINQKIPYNPPIFSKVSKGLKMIWNSFTFSKKRKQATNFMKKYWKLYTLNKKKKLQEFNISFKKIISNQIRHLENVHIDLNSLKSKKPEDICIHLSNRKIIPTFSQELYKLLQQQYEFNEDEKVNQFQAYIKMNNKVYFNSVLFNRIINGKLRKNIHNKSEYFNFINDKKTKKNIEYVISQWKINKKYS